MAKQRAVDKVYLVGPSGEVCRITTTNYPEEELVEYISRLEESGFKLLYRDHNTYPEWMNAVWELRWSIIGALGFMVTLYLVFWRD